MLDASVQKLRVCRTTVEFDGDNVIKRQSPDRSRFERERTQFGAGIASECGLFHVPEILSFDDTAGEIILRFIPGTVPLRSYLIKRSKPDLLERAGRALAAIHNAGSSLRELDVSWHGDYGLGNLLYSESHDRITIVDWNNAAWALEPPERSHGSAGLDLGIALLSLFHSRIASTKHISQPEQLGSIFLEGYARDRSYLQVKGIRPFISELFRRWNRYWLAHCGILRAQAYAPSMIRLRLFLSRTEFLGK